jgi:uncharacterized protein with GYD domain
MIADGTYDVVVVEAREKDDQALHIEFAITSGSRRGEVVTVMAKGLARPAIDLLGAPATLFVHDGAPHIEWS